MNIQAINASATLGRRRVPSANSAVSFKGSVKQTAVDGAKAAKDPVKDAANSVNQVANIIEILNNRRIGIKNKVKGMSNESKKSESNRKPCDITKPLHNEE